METTDGRTGHLGMLQVTIAPQSTSTTMFQPCQGGDLQMSMKDTGVRALTLWPSYDQTVPCFPITVFTIKVKRA